MEKNQLSTNQKKSPLSNTYHSIGELLKQENKAGSITREIINYYNDIISCMPGNVYWLDKNCLTVGCNQNVLDMFGLNSIEDFSGLSFDAMAKIGHWDQNQAAFFEKDTLEVIHSGKAKKNIEEPPIPDSKGNLIYFLTSRVPLFNSLGEVIGVVGISTDITQRKKMEQELVESKNTADSANRTKTEFLANLSHDVKTPLQSINILASSILASPNEEENNKQDAELILSCQKQLSVFFKNCLDNGNFELSSPELSEEKFSVKELLEEMHNIFSPNALEKNLSLSLEIDGSVNKTVIGCRAILFRIILNLISNALKFTEIGGIQIHASASPNSDENILNLVISVQDTGIGIPVDKQKVIFERLSRLAPAFSKRIEGSGIGLYIVDQYVKRMNGSIHVKSKPGEGSAFIVTVPLKIATDTRSSR